MWEVTAAACKGGCVCADAITMGASTTPRMQYFDPASPAIGNPALVVVTGEHPARPGVPVAVTAASLHTFLGTGGTIKSTQVSHSVMWRRLKFLTDLRGPGPAASAVWTSLDTAPDGNPTSTTMIAKAWTVVSAYTPPSNPPSPGTPGAPAPVKLPCTVDV